MQESTKYLFSPPEVVAVPVVGSQAQFPVHRIYCVGRNYADHAREMGHSDRERPFFFSKPADAVMTDRQLPFPASTANLHHEIELVVALHSGGRKIDRDLALEHVFGYAVGIDLTRRDLQAEAKDRGRPWDSSKGFDRSAPLSAISPEAHYRPGPDAAIELKVNGEVRQQGHLSQMIWSVAEIISELSMLFELRAGDLIFTGTPAGVAALKPGDRVEAGIDGLQPLAFELL